MNPADDGCAGGAPRRGGVPLVPVGARPGSPDFELADTAECEERLLAHLDGLVVGGEAVAGELLLPALETDERRADLRRGVRAAERERAAAVGGALGVLDSGDAVQRAGIGRALELSEREGLEAVLRKRLTAEEAALASPAFEVLSFRGAVPQETRVEWLYRDDAGQVVAALRDARPLLGTSARRSCPSSSWIRARACARRPSRRGSSRALARRGRRAGRWPEDGRHGTAAVSGRVGARRRGEGRRSGSRAC